MTVHHGRPALKGWCRDNSTTDMAQLLASGFSLFTTATGLIRVSQPMNWAVYPLVDTAAAL
ncbi:hypothetical protein [Ralstonia solanacearum]|uniref:hypothetical protein n=1 Tax=Ralstonia solanacearum TaxID=305 RepID=UPI000A121D72|nr:hypothetical protein [Ralstonia solanacearum]